MLGVTALVVRMVGRLQIRLEALYDPRWPQLEEVEIFCSESDGRWYVHCWAVDCTHEAGPGLYLGGCERQEALLDLFPLQVEVVELSIYDQDFV